MLNPELKDISIREDRSGNITVVGIHEEPVNSKDDLFRCLQIGGHERTTGDTKMHQHSSRSHAIFTLVLDQWLEFQSAEENQPLGTSVTPFKTSKLHLVDLAGEKNEIVVTYL